eukprot:8948454-Pyramimonas_sp.AAC.1
MHDAHWLTTRARKKGIPGQGRFEDWVSFARQAPSNFPGIVRRAAITDRNLESETHLAKHHLEMLNVMFKGGRIDFTLSQPTEQEDNIVKQYCCYDC